MATITSSPITFLDLTDQQQLSAYLGSNLSKIQLKGIDDKYTPSWEETALEITANVFLDQKEIDDFSEYTFTWSVKDGTEEEKIKEGKGEEYKTLKIESNELDRSDSGMLTYICRISCNHAEAITTDITYTLVRDGKFVRFSIDPQGGTIFKNQSGAITLTTTKYDGLNEIKYTPGSENPEFQWYKITAEGEKPIEGANADTLTVLGTEVINIATYKCKMTYNGVEYSDTITLQDVSDNYSSNILTMGGTIFKNGVGGSAAYVVVRANGKEEDPLKGLISASKPANPKEGDYWYCVNDQQDVVIEKQYKSGDWVDTDIEHTLQYSWYLIDKSGNVVKDANNNVKSFGNDKVVYLSGNNIDETATLCCEVRNGDKLLTVSQETFADLYDSYNVIITPDIASIPCDNDGNILYKTDDTGNTSTLDYEFKYAVDIQNNVIKAVCDLEKMDTITGLKITDDPDNSVIKISIDPDFNFGDGDDFSVKILIKTTDAREFTFERYITFIKVKEGEGGITFNVYSSMGDIFKEGMDEILVETIARKGSADIINATYTWYYYEDGDPDTPYPITIMDENGTSQPVTTSFLVVKKTANYAFLTLKCVMEYDGKTYEDYILLKDFYNPYTAQIKFLNQSNVIGVDDLYIIAYAELYKDNVVIDKLSTTRFWYHADNQISGNHIIPGGDFVAESDEDLRYLICRNSITLQSSDDYVLKDNGGLYLTAKKYDTQDNGSIFLGKYDSTNKHFTIVDNSSNFIYTNSLYTDLNSKIIIIPKEDIESSKELTFSIYHTTLDDDLLIAISNEVVINLNDKLGNISQVVKNVNEHMTFDPKKGLEISQRYENGQNGPFYVQITSEKMGFHERTINEKNEVVDDKEVVYISNKKANITDLTVQKSADFECSIDMININEESKATSPGFSFIIEEDGSLSLVKAEVN